MCGIAGIYAYRRGASPVDVDELIRIRDKMAARGPDGSGKWVSSDGQVGLAHRRLSIIDLSDAGVQPMMTGDGSAVISFNGEIYNYRSLRAGLEARGHVFRTQSDTEVILQLYAEKGAELVHDLRGMFAFGLWDLRRSRLLLARDPLGIKPLYYADTGGTLRFATQVKALMAGGALSNERDPAGRVGFYLTGSVPEPFTMYRDIKALPAGSVVMIDETGVPSPRRYYNLAQVYVDAENAAPGVESAQETIRAAVLDSVRHHLVADVPVGAFLSSGIDSGALVGLMHDLQQSDIETVTISFKEFGDTHHNEAPLAAEIAKLYHCRHTVREVAADEFVADLPLIFEAMDQPSIDGVNTWFVAKAAKELGLKVAISGLGGDELFGGYPSFRSVPAMVRWLSAPSAIPFAAGINRRLVISLGAQRFGVNPKAASLLELGGTTPGAYFLRRGLFMPWELPQVMDHDIVVEGLRQLDIVALMGASLSPEPRSSFGKLAVLESSHYMLNQLLRDADWASMAHGIEVRLPLVDSTLIRLVAPVTTRKQSISGKQLLAHCPMVPLPPDVANRKKSGFMTPVDKWQRLFSAAQAADLPALIAKDGPWARRWSHTVATHQF